MRDTEYIASGEKFSSQCYSVFGSKMLHRIGYWVLSIKVGRNFTSNARLQCTAMAHSFGRRGGGVLAVFGF